MASMMDVAVRPFKAARRRSSRSSSGSIEGREWVLAFPLGFVALMLMISAACYCVRKRRMAQAAAIAPANISAASPAVGIYAYPPGVAEMTTVHQHAAMYSQQPVLYDPSAMVAPQTSYPAGGALPSPMNPTYSPLPTPMNNNFVSGGGYQPSYMYSNDRGLSDGPVMGVPLASAGGSISPPAGTDGPQPSAYNPQPPK